MMHESGPLLPLYKELARYQVVVKVLVKYGTIHEIWFTIHGEDSPKCHHEVLADSPTLPSWNKRYFSVVYLFISIYASLTRVCVGHLVKKLDLENRRTIHCAFFTSLLE